MANNYNGKYFVHSFFFKYLNVNICFYTLLLLLSTDDFENIEFDEGLEEILEAICKPLYFLCRLV